MASRIRPMSNCPPMVFLTPISTLSKSINTAIRLLLVVVVGIFTFTFTCLDQGRGPDGCPAQSEGLKFDWLIIGGPRSSRSPSRFGHSAENRLRTADFVVLTGVADGSCTISPFWPDGIRSRLDRVFDVTTQSSRLVDKFVDLRQEFGDVGVLGKRIGHTAD